MSRLSQLAINDEGFVFDPTTGDSYTVNGTGLLVLKLLKEEKSPEEITKAIEEKFEVEKKEAEEDIKNFCDFLRAISIL